MNDLDGVAEAAPFQGQSLSKAESLIFKAEPFYALCGLRVWIDCFPVTLLRACACGLLSSQHFAVKLILDCERRFELG